MDIDIVIIGVNAQATLHGCIDSVLCSRYTRGRLNVVYVDGGSTDASAAIARGFAGVQVIELTPRHPSPGLGRNAGWRSGRAPLVQFLDSDTLLDPDWIETAVSAMAPGVGAVRGNRLEIHPEATVFNWLGSLEWNAPPGECDDFGGDVLIRRQALEDTGGYDEVLVGGEDPELSQRIRHQGWKIVQIDAPMTLHDLAMTRLSQYLKRGYRTGYGFAAVTARFGAAAHGYWRREHRRILIRGGGALTLATAAAAGGALVHPALLLLAVPALLLLLFPRLFRVPFFMADKGLGAAQARIYAWHCSLAVVPQFFGVLRYRWGALTGNPLRNRPANLKTGTSVMRLVALPLLALMLCACAMDPEPVPTPTPATGDFFSTEPSKTSVQFARPEAIAAESEPVDDAYRLGAGDVLELKVWRRPELSDPAMLVGPDGIITVARIGNISVTGRTRDGVAAEIAQKLGQFYETPEVTLAIKDYNNNKAFVLGRVAKPGAVTFPGQGTLLEAISLAGGLPVLSESAFLTKCAIFRGKNSIIWIDLRDLLNNGNLALNARIQNNDVIYIPESEDELIYVMGEVVKPGAIRLKTQLTYMDALMLSGGPTRNAELAKTFILRTSGEQRIVREIDLAKMIASGNFSSNYLLQDNDVLFVAAKGISQFNYVLEQLSPSVQFLDVSTNVLERFGVMQQFRNMVYGQEGFVNTTK